jgi:hypothetical protein
MSNNGVHNTPRPSHLVWEVVGSEVVILDTTSNTTYRLQADAARAFLDQASATPSEHQEVTTPEHRGCKPPRSPVSRRAVMTGGFAALSVGITSLALPAAAAAASSTTLTPSITAQSLEAGQWRWSPEQFGIDITQRQGSILLSNLPVFQAGDRWRLTLADLNGSPAEAEADVATVTGGNLQLTFSFPLSVYPPTATVLDGTLTKVSDPTVFSEQFPIPRV